MLVVCDIIDKHQNIDLREELQHLKVVGEFKDEEEVPQEKDEDENFIDPAFFEEEERFARLTVHKNFQVEIPKD